MTRDELAALLDEYATLHRVRTSHSASGTWRVSRPDSTRLARAAQIRQQILDAVTPV